MRIVTFPSKTSLSMTPEAAITLAAAMVASSATTYAALQWKRLFRKVEITDDLESVVRKLTR